MRHWAISTKVDTKHPLLEGMYFFLRVSSTETVKLIWRHLEIFSGIINPEKTKLLGSMFM